MRSLLIVTTFAILTCCTPPQTHIQNSQDDLLVAADKYPLAFYQVPFLGASSLETPTGLTIINVETNSPASKAGLQVGDKIIDFDETPVGSNVQLNKFIKLNHKNGDTVRMTINRSEKLIQKEIKLAGKPLLFDIWVLLQELMNDKEIRLAIVVGDISNSSQTMTPELLARWKESMKPGITSTLETIYVRGFKDAKKFTLIDRQHIETTLGELKLQNSGLISEQTTMKLGELLGATHLIVISYSRFITPPDHVVDHAFSKLIEVQSGKILSSYEAPLLNGGVVH